MAQNSSSSNSSIENLISGPTPKGCFKGVYADLMLRARKTGGRCHLDRGVVLHPQDKVFVDTNGVVYAVRRVTGKVMAIGRCELLPEVQR